MDRLVFRSTTSLTLSAVILLASSANAYNEPQYPYPSDGSGIFDTIDSDGNHSSEFPPNFNPCKNLYTATAKTKMDANVFNVRDFGAYGDGKSHPFQTGVLPSHCSNCSKSVQKIARTLLSKSLAKDSAGRSAIGIRSDDEWDWIAIQSAIYAAHSAGGGTVVIPDTGYDYKINRSFWPVSNVRIVWTTRAKAPHSFITLTKKAFNIGSVFGSYNPYRPIVKTSQYKSALFQARERSRANFVCKVYLHSPRIRAMIGENGLGFALGVYDIQVYNGFIKGARYGMPDGRNLNNGMYSAQGGRGIQLEAGVQQVLIKNLMVSDSTIGFSSTAGGFSARKDTSAPINKYDRYLNASNKIYMNQPTALRVDVPFLFSRAFYDDLLAPQSVAVKNFRAYDSGVLSPGINIGSNPTPYPGQSERLQVGIINLAGAKNVKFYADPDNVNVVDNDDRVIGSLIRGSGEQISISRIRAIGRFSALVDHHSPFGSHILSQPRLSHLDVNRIVVRGYLAWIIRSLPTNSNFRRIVNQSYANVSVSKNLPKYFDPGALSLPQDQSSSPNLTFTNITQQP